jgi:Neutral/alkaline non-lysosomal ceramidase, N-terminal
MRNPVRSFLILLGLSFFLLGNAFAASDASTWQVGLARAVITPSEPVWMAGYDSRKEPGSRKLHDLWVKAIAFEDAGGNRAVWVGTDLLGFPREVADRIAAEVEKKFSIARADLMLTSTHTHSGPVVGSGLSTIYSLDEKKRAAIRENTIDLEKKIVAVIGRAINSMEPALVSTGVGQSDVAVNRRNNNESKVPELRGQGKLVGPVDHRVFVLAARDPNTKKLRALVVDYACHATVLSIQKWSGDWPGFAQLALEEKYPGCQAMLASGCGADQNPLPRRKVELAQEYGQNIAAAVDTVLQGSMSQVEPILKTAYQKISLPFAAPVTRGEMTSLAKRDDYSGRYAKKMLELIDSSKPLPRSYDFYPIQVWRLGKKELWVALGGEVAVGYALNCQKLYGDRCWVFGYANDMMAYIPTTMIQGEQRAYEKGAFNVYGHPAHDWAVGVEKIIMDEVDRTVNQVK